MKVLKADEISNEKFEQIKQSLPKAENLWQVMNWTNSQPKSDFLPQIVAEVVVQDEFTHDVIIPFRDLFLVFDTTWLGAITAVAVWEVPPNADELLQFRLKNGWKPTPSYLKDGDKILGHASCVIDS